MLNLPRVASLLCLVPLLTSCVAEDEGPGDDLGSASLAVTTVFQTGKYAATCSPPQLVAAAPGEEGQWAAVRVGRTASRFLVTKVSFLLRGSGAGSWCGGNAGPYKVRLFYVTGPASRRPVPPANPTLATEVLVPAAAVAPAANHDVSIDLRTPIPASSDLYVGVEMVGNPATDTGYNCVAGCGPRTAATDWWSSTSNPPYAWTELVDLGLTNLDIGMKVEGEYY